jgi:hypothetical protein
MVHGTNSCIIKLYSRNAYADIALVFFSLFMCRREESTRIVNNSHIELVCCV